MAELSAEPTGRNLHLRNFLGTHFCYGISAAQAYWMRTERIGHVNISKGPTGNPTRNLIQLHRRG